VDCIERGRGWRGGGGHEKRRGRKLKRVVREGEGKLEIEVGRDLGRFVQEGVGSG
jgi:hypothetical protein